MSITTICYNSTAALTPTEFLQNLTNLYYSPRPPVFIPIGNTGSNDFRYYLDLNRNGRFDANGSVTNYDNARQHPASTPSAMPW